MQLKRTKSCRKGWVQIRRETVRSGILSRGYFKNQVGIVEKEKEDTEFLFLCFGVGCGRMKVVFLRGEVTGCTEERVF